MFPRLQQVSGQGGYFIGQLLHFHLGGMFYSGCPFGEFGISGMSQNFRYQRAVKIYNFKYIEQTLQLVLFLKAK